MTTILGALRNIMAAAAPLCDLGHEYTQCHRCGHFIQQYVVFEGRRGDYDSDLAPTPASFAVTLCHNCWNKVVDAATTQEERT